MKGSTLSKPKTIRELIDDWNAYVCEQLGQGFPCRDDTIVNRLLRYRDLIQPNFVPWMSKTWVGCRSEFARATCASNLKCEIEEDHPAMLTRYVAQATGGQVKSGTYRSPNAVRSNLNQMNELIDGDALSGLVSITLLENASLVFIPEMRRWGQILGFTDFEYVDKHGVADVGHADEFRRAVEAEAAAANFDLEHMKENYPIDVRCVMALLLTIFGDD